MTLNKRKKSIKFRGHHTHGYGSKKKHRGSGHQGGVGMAGSGKKADQKKPSVWKEKKYFGDHRKGFLTPSNLKSVNIFYIEEHFDSLLAAGKIKKEADAYAVNLKDFKAHKLLASGNPTRKYKVTCDFASAAAIEKITAAKGSVEVKAKKE